jgi:hypothetical protein
MSKSATHDSLWAEMSEAQRVESVLAGRATLKEIVARLLDGHDKLREACQEFLTHTDGSFEKLKIQTQSAHSPVIPEEFIDESGPVTEDLNPEYPGGELIDSVRKRRLGLPKGYVPRVYRH